MPRIFVVKIEKITGMVGRPNSSLTLRGGKAGVDMSQATRQSQEVTARSLDI